MCALCGEAVDLLVNHHKISEEVAMTMLWEVTAFPAGDGETVLKQVKEHIAEDLASRVADGGGI